VTNSLEKLRSQWTQLGETDPFWAVLTDRTKRGGRWEAEPFFQSGRDEIDAVMQELQLLDGPRDRALDFGCGLGRITQALSYHFTDVVGVDISAPMVDQAERLNIEHNPNPGRCRFVVNETPELSAATGDGFDLVYSTRVIQHMDPSLGLRYLTSLASKVAPGGHLVVQVPLRPSLHPKGLALRLLPTTLADRLRRMEMHGIGRAQVDQALKAGGCRLRGAVKDSSAGVGWISLRYHAVR
jgi:SAM-dependent methyltransferase